MLKTLYIFLIIGFKPSDWKNNLWDIIACKSFPSVTFIPCFKVKWGHHTKKALYLPYCFSRASNLLQVLNLTFDL